MDYDSGNVFARIIRGELPSTRVYEDEQVIAILDIEPAAPTHILVMPKEAFTSFDDFVEEAGAEAVGRFFRTVRRIAHDAGAGEHGYRLVTNHGADAAQSVPHFHVHILAGRELGRLLP